MSAAVSRPDVITISLPGVRLVNVLNGSQGLTRGGMFARAKERKSKRFLAAMAVNRHVMRVSTWLMCGGIVVTFMRISPRRWDDDAPPAACKSLRDGIADALGIDDRDPRCVWRYEQTKGKPNEYRVDIRIERREVP
jgi:hypothetical protein